MRTRGTSKTGRARVGSGLRLNPRGEDTKGLWATEEDSTVNRDVVTRITKRISLRDVPVTE